MSMSGIKLAKECTEDLTKLARQRSKTPNPMMCTILFIDKEKMQFTIKQQFPEESAKGGDQKQQYQHIVKEHITPLVKNEGIPCLVVWDLKMVGKTGVPGFYLIATGINLDTMKVKEKMLYGSSLDSLKKWLQDEAKVVKFIDVTDLDDLEYDEIRKTVEAML